MKKENISGGFLVFISILLVYIICLAPTIYLEDSAEFVAVADTLGIPHPSGYPLYVILGKLFSFLPISSLAWRINFMSAFFAALTGVMVFLLIKKFLIDNFSESKLWKTSVAMAGSWLLAFSQIFWSQAEIAEVYTLNCFLMSLIFYFIYQWSTAIKTANPNGKRYFLLTCFFYGLSLTNHVMMILFLPALVAFVLIVDQKIEKKKRLLLGGSLLFLGGLSVYLFLPLRAATGPEINWGETDNWGNLIRHVMRQDYQDLGLEWWHNWSRKINYVGAFLINLLAQYGAIGMGLGLGGIFGLWQKKKKFLFLALGFFLLNTLAVIFLRAGSYADYFFRVYYLPAYLIFACFIIYGWADLWEIVNKAVRKEWLKKSIKIVWVLLLLFLPLFNLIKNFSINNFSKFYFLDNYSRVLLDSLEPDAVLVLEPNFNGLDNVIFSLAYQKFSQNLRPDVTVASVTGIFDKPDKEALEIYDSIRTKKERRYYLAELFFEKYGQRRPVYVLFPLAAQKNSKIFTRSNGLVHKVYSNIEEAKSAKIINPVLEVTDENNYQLKNNYLGLYQMAQIFYARAAYYLETGLREEAQDFFRQALLLEPVPDVANSQGYIEHRAEWQARFKIN
ncbi:MAG TPA: DUF2723 domain-containing protein [bacterium]|nr:DUF2723 domain-containing protein [bacterium]HPL95685.1 DUF2723 domain-containing protein [bacterium]